jgi:8-oxo-dGTP diphosphatase
MRSEFASADARVPVAAVDVAIFTVHGGVLRVVLVKTKKRPYSGLWELPGWKIRSDESLEEAAYRELVEKTGLKSVYLEQLYTFGEVERDRTGRAVSTVYFALVNAEGLELKTAAGIKKTATSPAKRGDLQAFINAGQSAIMHSDMQL